jgi:quaternary ammonium compound-resistance protein SugE
MAWGLLVIAGLLEVVWALALRSTQGFTRLWPSVLTIVAMGLSFYLLARSLRTISPGVGYAVWVGIGAVGVALLSPSVLREPALSWRQLVCVGLIVLGIAGLKLFR